MTPVGRVALGALVVLSALSAAGAGTSTWSQPAGAQAVTRPARRVGIVANPDSALAIALAEIEGDPLSLERAIDLGITQSTTAREAVAALRAAEGALRREQGAFDPELFATSDWRGDEIPTASPFARPDVLDTETSLLAGGLRVQLPTGTELEASLESGRLATNSEFATLSPQYSAAGKLAVRQPVLKGFGPSARGDLSAAERDLESAAARYEDTILAVRAQVEQVYWDLYAAARDLAVQRLIRDGGAALVEQSELRAGAGLVGPGDVANARVFLAEQEQSVIDREEALDRISDTLAAILGQRPAEGFLRFRPTAEPPRDFQLEPADSLVARAVARNRELAASERRVEALRALADGAKWDALPALDIYGSLGGVGLTGRRQEVVFGDETYSTRFSGDRGEAVGDAIRRDLPNWNAGLILTYPLGLRADRGERDRLRAQVAQAREAHRAARYNLEVGVRASHRELANSTRRLAAAESGVEAAVEQVRIGSLEYQAGRTTAFELVRLAGDLAFAQQRYSQALVRTAKAAAELRRLTAEDDTAVTAPE